MAIPTRNRIRQKPRDGEELRRRAPRRQSVAERRVSDPQEKASRAADGEVTHSTTGRSNDGMGLIGVFLAATAVMVVGVLAVGAIDRTWVLVPVVFVHLVLTFWVLSYIYRLMAGGE